MTGPKIIDDPIDVLTGDGRPMRAATEGQTGIRRSPSSSNSWDVIVNGRLVETFAGLGSQSKAGRAAGTTRILP